jgi:hypothetical protein
MAKSRSRVCMRAAANPSQTAARWPSTSACMNKQVAARMRPRFFNYFGFAVTGFIIFCVLYILSFWQNIQNSFAGENQSSRVVLAYAVQQCGHIHY